MNHEDTYATLRADVLARHFALGKFWRTNHSTNVNLLGELGGELPAHGKLRYQTCFTAPCVPRRPPGQGATPTPTYATPTDRPESDDTPAHGISDTERWRVWTHDRTNALKMNGVRLIQLCVEHRLGQPQAVKIIRAILDTTEALFKYPNSSPFHGYILRWDPVSDDDWWTEIDSKGFMTPLLPCRFLLNSDLKNFRDQRYLYCTPLDDPRYRAAIEASPTQGMGLAQDRFRRWEPSKDEYVGLLAGLSEVFDTFSGSPSPDDRAIVDTVKAQCRRVARYLQRFGYLIVRPCGGVAARGAGEILPLLEYAFRHVFRRILGEEFPSAVSYAEALASAGIRVPLQLTGSAGLNVLEGAQTFLSQVRDATGGHLSLAINELVGQMDEHRRSELMRLWQNREIIDAADISMQGEVLVGMLFNGLRPALRQEMYFKWLRRAGSGISDSFKPYIALMLMNDNSASIKAYLDWFDAAFKDPGSANLSKKGFDWSFALAVALLAAGKLGKPTHKYSQWLETRLKEMREQLHHADPDASPGKPSLFAVLGKGSAPEGGMVHESAMCSSGPQRVIVSEFQDKVGVWWGYLPTLALAWRHLLNGGQAFSPSSGIAMPTSQAVSAWPEPTVPADVIAQARERPDRMPVPVNAISLSDRSADGSRSVPLFRDPPARPNDNALGRPPDPVGNSERFNIKGKLLRFTKTLEFAYSRPVNVEQDADNWVAAPSFDVSEETLIEKPWPYRISGDRLYVDVTLRAMAIEWAGGRFGVLPVFKFARFSGTVHLAWTWRQ